MPKRTRQIPQMRHFKPRNLARVRIDGQDVYLGNNERRDNTARTGVEFGLRSGNGGPGIMRLPRRIRVDAYQLPLRC